MANKIEELYTQAHKYISDAKALLEGDEALTDKQREDVDRWLQQAEEIEGKAKRLEKAMQKDLELFQREQDQALEAEKSRQHQRDAVTEFKDGGEYMLAIYNYREKGRRDPRLEKLEAKDLLGEQGIYGGFAIPTQQRTDILTAMAENSIVQPRAQVVPMASRLVDWLALDLSQGAAGVSAFFAGVRVYYTEEMNNITESQPKFRNIQLHAREMAGYAEIPNGLIRDSAISMEAFLRGPNSFGGALGWQKDYDYIRGNGVGRPLGVLNCPAKLLVSRNTASTFKFVDAVTMASKMVMGRSPVWLINQSVMPQLFQMVDGATNNIWLPNAAGGGPQSLLGWPIIWTEKLPALGTAGDVMLVDWSWYIVGDRQEVTMDIDRSYKFQANATAFRALIAHDGQPWLNNYITLADGSTTVSPVVYLS